MIDTEYTRLVETAKERAFAGFQRLAQRTLQDAGTNIVQQLLKKTSAQEQEALTGVRTFMEQDCDVFLHRMDTLFKTYLDRAFQTMYVDQRTDIRQLSIDELSLTDAEAINHQIEIERVAQRIREANEIGVARLNVIISTLHGRKEPKERENPFRPYLLARTLYEATKSATGDALKAKVLFDRIADAMVLHLPEFYSAIREVFETSGINGRLAIRATKDPFSKSSFGPFRIPAHPLFSQTDRSAPPDLAGLIQVPEFGKKEKKPDVRQEFIQIKEDVPRVPSSRVVRKSIRVHPLAAQLTQLQKKIAQGEGRIGAISQDDQSLFELRDSLDLHKTSAMDRLTVEVVSTLFSFIFNNEQIPTDLRCRLARLQVPMLKAAILAPEVLHHDDHPARQLFNRMSSMAVGIDPESEMGRNLAPEIDRIINRVLEEFDDDVSIFATALDEFEKCLAEVLCKSDAQVMLGIEALEAAERSSILLNNITTTLSDLLLPLSVDKRISDFITAVWSRVMVRAAWSDAEKGTSQTESSIFLAYRNILPELLWSLQEKPISKDRTLLVRMLPDLVKGIRQALETISLPEEESKAIMSQIVTMHTQVLRGEKMESAALLMELDEFRQFFSQLVIYWQHVRWDEDEPPQIREEAVEDVLAHYRITPIVHFTQATVAASAEDHELLEWTCRLGSKVTMRINDDSNRQAQLMWVNKYRSLYLFKRDGDDVLVIYTYASLLESLRQSTITSVDCASLFERAIDSLLLNAGKSRIDSAA